MTKEKVDIELNEELVARGAIVRAFLEAATAETSEQREFIMSTVSRETDVKTVAAAFRDAERQFADGSAAVIHDARFTKADLHRARKLCDSVFHLSAMR